MRNCLESEKSHFEAIILPIDRGGLRSAGKSKWAGEVKGLGAFIFGGLKSGMLPFFCFSKGCFI